MRTNRRKNLYLALTVLILLLGVGYAAMTTALKINGTVDVYKATWDVHFENVQETTGSVTANPAPTTNNTDTTEMTYTINFTKPGDFYEFTVDIVNNGSIDAMIEDVSNKVYASNGTTEIQLPSYLTSSLTYSDGTPILQNQLLPKKDGNTKTVETIKVRIEFKKDIQASDLPSSGDTTIKFKFIGKYKQADENAFYRIKVCTNNENITSLSTTKCTNNENVVVPTGTICKRAINLHQEECQQNNITYFCSGAGYSQGSMITYGNCGTQQTNPVSGDAFTCDVNGDGEFDELTERFYYVSDYYDTTNKTFDNTTAVLVYYNNTAQGYACNTSTYAYDLSNENWHGPVDAKVQLPTTAQWKNVSLKNDERAILAEFTTTHDRTSAGSKALPTNYSYSGYAARLLTAKELMSGCGLSQVGNWTVGEVDTCSYFMENTSYSTDLIQNSSCGWLETPFSDNSRDVWIISSAVRYVTTYYSNNAAGGNVRPTIDVPKSKMVY